MTEKAITTINKDTFWELLAEAKEICGNLDAVAFFVVEALKHMEPEQALRFHFIAHEYGNLAYKFGLWTAASILANGCSDDRFIDFRCWLIAQGRDTYLAALKDPDTLVNLTPSEGCSFGSLNYLGNCVYEEMTGRSAYDETPSDSLRDELRALAKDIEYGPNVNYPMEWDEMEKYLPKLCAKYLTPELIRRNAGMGTIWNHSLKEIQKARNELPDKGQKKPREKGGDAR